MIHQQYPLLLHNTFGMDVKAARFLEYNSVDELLRFIHKGEITLPYLHLGGGSNLLFTKDYEGTILHSRITGIDILQESSTEVVIRVGAGHVWDDLVAYCVEQGWYGTENLSIIPGEVGASAVQNIGAYGVEVKDLITTVETINIQGERADYPVTSCAYTYRDSIFKRATMKGVFITHVCFKLSKIEHYTLDYGTIRQELEKHASLTLSILRQVIIDIRDSKLPDPRVMGNAGSFFMNPILPQTQFDALLKKHPQIPFYVMGLERVKIPAGWLIDQCGWKGKSLGPAAVHSKQALVLVNLGGATGSDIVALSDAVRASVHQKFGVDIQPEVNIL